MLIVWFKFFVYFGQTVPPTTAKQKDIAFNDKWTGLTTEFYGEVGDVWWNKLFLNLVIRYGIRITQSVLSIYFCNRFYQNI